MDKVLMILSIALIMTIAALSGCLGPGQKITTTVAPMVPTATETVTPTPIPTPGVAQPTVAVSGDRTTIRGSKDGVAKGFTLGEGIYLVTWSGSGSYASFSLTDYQGNGEADITKGRTDGKKLFSVDGRTTYAGDFTLKATSDSDWTVKIGRPEASSATGLPLSFAGSEVNGAVSAPFRAHAGEIKISYSFSRTPQGTGYVKIYDIASGGSFYTRPMTEGAMIGQSNAEVPADGTYIAQLIVPPGAAYADITLSQ